MAAPNKAEREQCWAAKDKLWECMDRNPDELSKCEAIRKEFEGNCSKTWVKYFDRRRDYLKYKDKIEKEGFDPVDGKS